MIEGQTYRDSHI
uniref:Uncharacterized protein n=1 Tax=Lepeophtheirus salmonis TaxID=72036 RepID=A0A0K2T2N3_LEPSM